MFARTSRVMMACVLAGATFAVSKPALGQGSGSRTSNLLPSAPATGTAIAPGSGVASGGSPLSNQPESVELSIGEQFVISSANVQSYSEGAKGIADVRLTKDASQFVIVGLREGVTTLLLLMSDRSERHIRIAVTDPNASQERKKLKGEVQARDNIRLDFYFVQVSQRGNYQIGLGWPSSVAASGSASFNAMTGTLDSATVVVSNQALPRLDMGQSSGWAKVMRQAAVITANGEKASFGGGGEINVAIKSAMTTGIQKIPYGAQIDIEPRYDSKTGRIEVRLHADVSELEDDQGTGVPGRTTASLDTMVNLELGQSLILGGLTAKSERSSKTGLPVLSQIPIIGALFGTRVHAEGETENVVLIVPSVVDAISMQDRARLDHALRRYDEYSGDMDEHAKFVPQAKPLTAVRKESRP